MIHYEYKLKMINREMPGDISANENAKVCSLALLSAQGGT